MLVQWQEQMSVGIQEIDGQHKQLIQTINFLHQAILDKVAVSRVREILDEMTLYAIEHFSTEERYFDKYGYPEAALHRAEHEAFKEKVKDFIHDEKAGKASVTLEVINFLKDWLLNHILGSDQSYGPYLQEKGLK